MVSLRRHRGGMSSGSSSSGGCSGGRGLAVRVRAEYQQGRDTTFGMREKMLKEKQDAAGSGTFWGKVKAAFKIFFPPTEEDNARLEAKKRLRMILVADRCAMSAEAINDMKLRIIEVVSDFVDVDEELGVEVSTSTDPEIQGTMYAVSIPVRRVKPAFDVENETYGWDEEPVYEENPWQEEEAAAAGTVKKSTKKK